MENTFINKSKFFAQYIRQEVLKKSDKSLPIRLIGRDLDSKNLKDNHHLALIPLQNITDKDAIEVARILKWQKNTITEYRKWINGYFSVSEKDAFTLDDELPIFTSVALFQYLQSKGYALPFHDVSVEQQIEYGWTKLKED